MTGALTQAPPSSPEKDSRPTRGSQLTASRIGSRRSTASGSSQQRLSPCLPALGHPRHGEQPPRFVAIAGVDAKHIADAQALVGTFDYPDLVAGGHRTLGKNSQIRSGAQRLGEASDEALIVHPDAEPPAGHAGFGDLEQRGPDLPALADERPVHLDPLRGQVLAELPDRQRSAELALPPPQIFDRIGVDGLVDASVRLPVSLIVA